MLTPQEVSNRAFAKAIMGGYNMTMVDEFLDELTDDYTALYKENAALKAKMKVLVDKVEEYRSTEDSMRAALLTAQKMASTMVTEAEEKSKEMVADAEAQARKKIGGLEFELEREEQRLADAKAATARFLEEVRAVYQRGLAMLDEMPDLTVASPAQTLEETKVLPKADVSEIEAKILASFAPAVGEEKDEVMEETVEEVLQEQAEETVEEEEGVEEGNPFVEVEHVTPKLSELKFGRNYRAEK